MEIIEIGDRTYEVVKRTPIDQATKHASVLTLYRAQNIAAKLELKAVVTGYRYEAFEHAPDQNGLVRHTALGRQA